MSNRWMNEMSTYYIPASILGDTATILALNKLMVYCEKHEKRSLSEESFDKEMYKVLRENESKSAGAEGGKSML